MVLSEETRMTSKGHLLTRYLGVIFTAQFIHAKIIPRLPNTWWRGIWTPRKIPYKDTVHLRRYFLMSRESREDVNSSLNFKKHSPGIRRTHGERAPWDWITCTVYLRFTIHFEPNGGTLPKFNSSPLKNDRWKTIVSFWDGIFSGANY